MSIIRQRRRVWLAFVLLSWPTIAIGLVSSVETERIRAAIHAVEASVAQETVEARKQAALENAYSNASIAEVKNRVIEIAFEFGAPGTEEFMLRVLQHDPDVRLRIAAVNALARHGSKKSIPLLFRCARSDPGGMGGWDCTRYPATPRREAFLALAQIGLREPVERESIANGLASIPDTVPGLRDALIQARFLLTRDMRLLDTFLARLAHPDPKVREKGVVAFRGLGLNEVPSSLRALIDDPDVGIRSWALIVTTEIEGQVFAPTLVRIALNREEHFGVRCNAITALGGLRDTEAIPPLTGLLEDRNVSIRLNAAIALSRITGRRHPLVPEGYKLDLPAR